MSWRSARSSLQTDCTALECGLLFFSALSCTQQKTKKTKTNLDLFLIKTLTKIYLNGSTHTDKQCIKHIALAKRERKSNKVRSEGKAQPVSEALGGTSADRKRETERKRDCISQAEFGAYCCVFSPCSTALTLPAARLGVCRLRGFYQHAGEQTKFTH